MKIIVLVGIPGVGKSSILQELARQIPAVAVINYGDKMLEEAAKVGISRDLMRKMPIKDQQVMGIQAAKNIVLQKREGIVLIDTHALIKTPVGFCPGLPREVLEIFKPLAYACVECSPEKILERRAYDLSRTRDAETVDDLARHQELTRSFLAACCMHTSSVLCCLSNNDHDLSQNVQPLVRLIQSNLNL